MKSANLAIWQCVIGEKARCWTGTIGAISAEEQGEGEFVIVRERSYAKGIRGSVRSVPRRDAGAVCRHDWGTTREALETGGSRKDLKPPRTPGGEDDRAAKPHLLFERHDSISDLQLWITDLANGIDHLLEGFGESPGGNGPTSLVEVIDVRGGDGRRGGALRIGKGNLSKEQRAALGVEDFGHPEAEEQALPGQHDLLTVAEDGREDLPSRPRLRKFNSSVPRPGTPGQNHEERQEDQKQGRETGPRSRLLENAFFLEELLGARM